MWLPLVTSARQDHSWVGAARRVHNLCALQLQVQESLMYTTVLHLPVQVLIHGACHQGHVECTSLHAHHGQGHALQPSAAANSQHSVGA